MNYLRYMMVKEVETYLVDGCGRCNRFGTDECKVRTWSKEVHALRSIALASGLKEEMKWGSPCYTLNGKNVVMLAVFNDFASLSFFKGSLLKDGEKVLTAPGKNSQTWSQWRFTSITDIANNETQLQAYIQEAIEIEKSGLKVETKREEDPIPEELETAFANDPELESAFKSLTPGRQRGYLIFFNGAKQSATRTSRIEKHKQRILQGLGMHDR